MIRFASDTGWYTTAHYYRVLACWYCGARIVLYLVLVFFHRGAFCLDCFVTAARFQGNKLMSYHHHRHRRRRHHHHHHHHHHHQNCNHHLSAYKAITAINGAPVVSNPIRRSTMLSHGHRFCSTGVFPLTVPCCLYH